jgi:type IV pilus assembly protein PilN
VQINDLRYLSNAELSSAQLDRDTFAQPAINFEVASELITVAGENGTEVRLDGGSPTEAADTGVQEERYQARVDQPGSER